MYQPWQNNYQQSKNRTKNRKTMIPTLCPLPLKSQNKWITPQPSHPPIICSNNIMSMRSLAQMKQSNGYGSVKHDDIFNLHLGSGASSRVTIPCLLQNTSHIHWLHPPKQWSKKKQKILKKDLTPNKSNRIALAYIHRTQGQERWTWNPALREVVTRLTG